MPGAGDAHAAALARRPARIPDFTTRTRFLDAGPCTLQGRAWSGQAPWKRVEVSTTGADLGRRGTRGADRRLRLARGRYDWDARPASTSFCCRATDAAGNTQPSDPPWNLEGYCNNAIQRVTVIVA